MEQFKAIAEAQKIINKARLDIACEYGTDNPAWSILLHAGDYLKTQYADIRKVAA